MRGPARPRLRGSWLPLLGAVLVSGVLLATSLFLRQSVREASALVVQGMAGALGFAGQEALRGVERPPSAQTLAALLEAHQEEGLRGVAVVDEEGRVLVQAGQLVQPVPRASRERTWLTFEGDRARLLRWLPPPRPPGRAAMEGRRPPRTPPLRIAYEFEPVAALQLAAHARRLLWVAAAACVGILALAWAFSRALAQRERMQEELERGRRLAALGEMSGVLAHELRNPLTSLKGHAQLLAETLEGDARLSAKAERVVGEAVRLEQRMNDLLAFVRTGTLHLAPADPNEVLRAAVEAVGRDGVEVHPLPEPTPWPLDTARLQQALENVLRNALQASPAGRPVQARVALEGGTLHYQVRDFGQGIAPGEEERIFEPFVTHKVRGVGLGLAVTRRIVELHGGSVRAANHPAGGAEFHLTLPRKEA